MIRALSLCVTAAVFWLVPMPAMAQDFRGLLPGMPAGERGRLGEPLAIAPPDETGLIRAVYPLPFDQRLEVHHDTQRILALMTWTQPFAAALGGGAHNGGLESYTSTVEDVIRLAGSEGYIYEPRGQVYHEGSDALWWMVYPVADAPDLLLEFRFFDTASPNILPTSDDGLLELPHDAQMTRATLYHRDAVSMILGDMAQTLTPRPGAAPFALPIAEAFPFTEYP